jgi:hypothetical protein
MKKNTLIILNLIYKTIFGIGWFWLPIIAFVYTFWYTPFSFCWQQQKIEFSGVIDWCDKEKDHKLYNIHLTNGYVFEFPYYYYVNSIYFNMHPGDSIRKNKGSTKYILFIEGNKNDSVVLGGSRTPPLGYKYMGKWVQQKFKNACCSDGCDSIVFK